MKKFIIGCLSAIILLMFVGEMSYVITTRIISNNDTSENRKSQSTANQQSNINDKIITYVYIPNKLDKRANVPFYVIIKNTAGQYFEGTYKIDSSLGMKESDKVGYLKLLPHEIKLIPCTGTLPAKDTKIKNAINGNFSKDIFENDPSLEYTIVKKDIFVDDKPEHAYFFVYIPPNISDEIYMAVSKEFKINYSSKYILTVIRYSPVFIDPNEHDTFAIYRRNNIMNFSQLLFYTTNNNNAALKDDVERRIINDF